MKTYFNMPIKRTGKNIFLYLKRQQKKEISELKMAITYNLQLRYNIILAKSVTSSLLSGSTF
ncbi:MAG: hypothetical protein WBL27_00660 [Salinimicrobium sp.]